MAVTGLTRNQFTGLTPVRGFESLRLREKKVSPKLFLSFGDTFLIINSENISFVPIQMTVNRDQHANSKHNLRMLRILPPRHHKWRQNSQYTRDPQYHAVYFQNPEDARLS